MGSEYYKEKIEPFKAEIYEMVVKGVPEYQIRECFSIGKDSWQNEKKLKTDLYNLIMDAKEERKELDKEAAEIYIANKPPREYFVNAMKEKIDSGKATIPEIIRAWNKVYPEDDWFRQNEIERTKIMKEEGETSVPARHVSISYDIQSEE